MTRDARDLGLCGWRARSDIALPELREWRGADEAPIDLTVELGTVPDALVGAIEAGPFLQFTADGTCRFEVAAVARYLVTGGRNVIVDTRLDVADPAIRLFLFGSVLDALSHQRGVLPLHASAVEIDGRAVLFAGGPGSGKSVLAAALAERGHRVIADDVCVVHTSDAAALALPSVARLALWKATLPAFGFAPSERARLRAGINRFAVDVGACDEALPIAAIYHLQSHAARGQLTRLAGMHAIAELFAALRMPALANHLLGERGVFEALTRIAAPIPSHFRFAPGPGAAAAIRSAELIRARHMAAS